MDQRPKPIQRAMAFMTASVRREQMYQAEAEGRVRRCKGRDRTSNRSGPSKLHKISLIFIINIFCFRQM